MKHETKKNAKSRVVKYLFEKWEDVRKIDNVLK